ERRLRCTEKLDDVLLELLILLVDDRVARCGEQCLRIDVARKRIDVAAELEHIAHRKRVRIAWYGNDVLWLENLGLLEYLLSYFGERHAVCRRVEILQP